MDGAFLSADFLQTHISTLLDALCERIENQESVLRVYRDLKNDGACKPAADGRYSPSKDDGLPADGPNARTVPLFDAASGVLNGAMLDGDEIDKFLRRIKEDT